MNGKELNETELTETNKNAANGEVDGKIETQKESSMEKKTNQGLILRFFNFFTVEPFLLCFIVPNAISSLAVQKLNMEKACRVDLNYTEDICNEVVNGNTSSNFTEEVQVAAIKLVADMASWQYPLQSAIPAIAILFVGAWSDKTGNRKALMMIPMFGELISAIGLFWATYFFLEWPLWVTAVIESIPSALCGGISIALLGSYSYIADMTTVESRTFRMGVLTVIVSLGLPFGTSISGVLTEAVGYYGIFTISTVLFALGLVHTYFRVQNIRHTVIEGTLHQRLIEFFNPRNVWDTLSLLALSRGRKLAQIILVIISHILIMGPVMAEGAVVYLYTLKKFGIDVVEFSLYSTYYVLMGTAGTAVAVGVFSKWLKMHDAFIGIIATACKTVSSFVFGLAPTKIWFYSGPIFDFFGNSGVTAIRSLGTKVVDPDQVGLSLPNEANLNELGETGLPSRMLTPLTGYEFIHTPKLLFQLMRLTGLGYFCGHSAILKHLSKMCSLLGLAEALMPVVYTPLYTKVFSNTVDTFSGAFYVLGGAMTIPAFVAFIALYILHKKQQKDIVKDPAKKEAHTYDNDVTAL